MKRIYQNIIIFIAAVALLFYSESIYETLPVISIIFIFVPVGMLGFLFYRFLMVFVNLQKNKAFKWLSKIMDVEEWNVSKPLETMEAPLGINPEIIDHQYVFYCCTGVFKDVKTEVGRFMVCTINPEATPKYENIPGTYIKMELSETINKDELHELLKKSEKNYYIETSNTDVMILIEGIYYIENAEITQRKKYEFTSLLNAIYSKSHQ